MQPSCSLHDDDDDAPVAVTAEHAGRCGACGEEGASEVGDPGGAQGLWLVLRAGKSRGWMGAAPRAMVKLEEEEGLIISLCQPWRGPWDIRTFYPLLMLPGKSKVAPEFGRCTFGNPHF